MIAPIDLKIAIASGKGGTGKTMVSTNLFYVLQTNGYKAVLVDCDAEEPNDMVFFNTTADNPANEISSVDKSSVLSTEVNHKVPVIDASKCTFCGKCREYCSYNAILMIPLAGIIRVIDDQCHGCGACIVACEHGAITERDVELGRVNTYNNFGHIVEAVMKPGTASPVKVIKAAIQQAFSIETPHIVLMDSPPGTSCPFIHTVLHADHVILVTEPTPFGLSDLKQSVETLKTMGKSYSVIINRADIGNHDVLNYLLSEDIPLLMEIIFNKSLAYHYSNGEIAVQYQPELGAQFLQMISKIIETHANSSNQR